MNGRKKMMQFFFCFLMSIGIFERKKKNSFGNDIIVQNNVIFLNFCSLQPIFYYSNNIYIKEFTSQIQNFLFCFVLFFFKYSLVIFVDLFVCSPLYRHLFFCFCFFYFLDLIFSSRLTSLFLFVKRIVI